MPESETRGDGIFRRAWDRFTGKAAIEEHWAWWNSLPLEEQERQRRQLDEAKLWDDDCDFR